MEVFMTREQFELYVETAYAPMLKRIPEERRDSYQQAIIHIMEEHERYDVEDDKNFQGLVHKCASLRYRQTDFNNRRKLENAGVTGIFPLGCANTNNDEDSFDHDEAPDPSYETTVLRDRALEYIELLPKVYRQIFMKVYIEGKTAIEVSDELNLSQGRVSQMLTDGVVWIKDELRLLGEL
jgi:RNA polymerase sigma factor (sigma-70 family)